MTVKGAAAGRREERRLEKLERAAAKRRQVEDDIQRRKMGRSRPTTTTMESYDDASFLQMLASLIPFVLAWYLYNLFLHELPMVIAWLGAVVLFGVLRAVVEQVLSALFPMYRAERERENAERNREAQQQAGAEQGRVSSNQHRAQETKAKGGSSATRRRGKKEATAQERTVAARCQSPGRQRTRKEGRGATSTRRGDCSQK